MSRSARKWLSLFLVGAMLFAQGAIAAHACPGMSGIGPTLEVEVTTSGPADCAQVTRIDERSPNVCLGHCQFGQQSNDHPVPPQLFPVELAARYFVPADTEATAFLAEARRLARLPVAASPPHAILHCCLRT